MDLGYYRCPVEGCGEEFEAETVADEAFGDAVAEHIKEHLRGGGRGDTSVEESPPFMFEGPTGVAGFLSGRYS
jgi:hypothetical protein